MALAAVVAAPEFEPCTSVEAFTTALTPKFAFLLRAILLDIKDSFRGRKTLVVVIAEPLFPLLLLLTIDVPFSGSTMEGWAAGIFSRIANKELRTSRIKGRRSMQILLALSLTSTTFTALLSPGDAVALPRLELSMDAFKPTS